MTTSKPVVSTPRTDAMCGNEFESAAHTVSAWTKLARQLETELSASAERIAGLERDLAELVSRK